MTSRSIAGSLALCRQIIGRYRDSIAFHLTLSYGLLAIVTTLVLLAFIYVQVIGVMRTQLSEQIDHAEQRLALEFATGNIAAVSVAVNRAIADELDGADDLFLLSDHNGNVLAGNIEEATHYPVASGMFETVVKVNGMQVVGYFKRTQFPDGHALLIGRESGKIEHVSAMILRGMGTAVALALLLIASGTYIFRRKLERSVRTLRTTARRIGPGQLSLRVPEMSAPDEFSQLSQDVNAMLDRVEKLMKGVRHVSDSIAHELRTPLMRMQGRLRSAQIAGASHDELAETVDRVALETDALTALLGQLLQISELEAGVRRKPLVPCRLDLIAADLTDLYYALAEDRNISVCLQAHEPCTVQGDAPLLGNVCANLIDNAVKYASHAVKISISSNDTSVILIIEDDGPGVPQDSLAQLGERFYRLDTDKDGLGLGLATVKAITAVHGGSVEITNCSYGATAGGLRVKVLFPKQPHSI